MSFQVLRCGGCQEPVTTRTSHEHHLIPQAAGGRFGPKTRLCAQCHTLVHHLGRALRMGTFQDMLDQVRVQHQDGATVNRLVEMARIEAREMEAKQRGLKQLDPNERVRVSFELTRAQAGQLARLARDLVDPATGRTKGVRKYLEALVVSHLRQKGIS